mmetsp:Transcript_59558/g.128887  ORF Transcript_59558/g.128887 Transcript_59558/m.128887 type:complete len:853 (-) Transcript_59558:259-2817(-)
MAYHDPGGPNGYSHAPQQDPMGTGLHGGAGLEGDRRYMEFTEDAKHTQHGGHESPYGEQPDPRTGLFPSRVTDCVVIVIFGLYLLGMFIVVIDAASKGDTRRLTHAYDFKARLCGVDEMVADKPMLYYCRQDPAETTSRPAGLNVAHPTCVAECPNATGPMVACLQPEVHQVEDLPVGAFDSIETIFISSQQRIALTKPYSTKAFNGRYCLPTDSGLKAELLSITGPLNIFQRTLKGFGSFQDCWWVMLSVSFFALIMGYVFLLTTSIRHMAKWFILLVLHVVLLFLVVAGIFFLYAIVCIFVHEGGAVEPYKANNPFYAKESGIWAASYSIAAGVGMLCIAAVSGAVVVHIEDTFLLIEELMTSTWECIWSMRPMWLLPVFGMIFKYLFLYFLCYNFMYLASVGSIDKRPIMINGDPYTGETARYSTDWWMIIGVVYYLFGAVWIMETVNAFGQFIISYMVIQWWYTEKEGRSKAPGTFRLFAQALLIAVKAHFGTILLGAAIQPWTRIPRLTKYLLQDNLPDENEQGAGCLCKCFGKCVKRLMTCCGFFTYKADGWIAKFTKDVFMDVIVRSQLYFPAAERSLSVIKSHAACKSNTGRLTIITCIAFNTVGLAGAAIVYFMLKVPALSDPTSGTYIQDPFMIMILAFWQSGLVCYGVMMMLDHTSDVLLWCYAWNKKSKKALVEKVIPESLRDVVGYDDHVTDSYPYYGKADQNMYLGTYLNFKAPKAAEKKAGGGRGTTATAAAASSAAAPQATAAAGHYDDAGHGAGYGQGYGMAPGQGYGQGFDQSYGGGYPTDYPQGGYDQGYNQATGQGQSQGQGYPGQGYDGGYGPQGGADQSYAPQGTGYGGH